MLGAGILYLASRPPRGEAITLLPAPTAEPLTVHITGAVALPGVYPLPVGSRVKDAVEAAGGLLPEAQAASINLAAPLQDGTRIYIPSIIPGEEQTQDGTGAGNPDQPNGNLPGKPININTASQAELDSLPGIGPTLAGRIIAYRQEHGLFKTIEDIQDVSGIGPGIFGKIKDLISVEGQP